MESNQDSTALAQQVQALAANRRRTGPRAVRKMKGIVREEVTAKDLSLRMIRIQTSFER